MYHNSGDLSDREGFDFEQVHAITTGTSFRSHLLDGTDELVRVVVLATLLETAEFQFSI